LDYILPAWYGWLLGMGVSLLFFGPAFFLLINTSIKSGFGKGVSLAVGVFVSDLVLVVLINLGLSAFYENKVFQLFFSAIAGVAMLVWGIKTLRGKYKSFLYEMHLEVSKKGSILKGFILNTLNPFAFVFWTTLIVNMSGHFDSDDPFHSRKVLIAVLFTLFGFLSMDTIKSFVFHKIGKKISLRSIYGMNKIIGVIIIGAGCYFMWNAVNLLFECLALKP